MAQRLKLSNMLHGVLGSNNVYFKPPPSLKMSFPCIVYDMVRINTDYADNRPYHLYHAYHVTYVDTNPDSDVPDKLALLPNSVFERSYKADNKYYYTYRITI